MGMSGQLNNRLKSHQKLIEKYTNQQSSSFFNDTQREKNADSSFALQVCRRNIDPCRLFVAINEIKSIGNEYIDIENILNRIQYPLMGRN